MAYVPPPIADQAQSYQMPYGQEGGYFDAMPQYSLRNYGQPREPNTDTLLPDGWNVMPERAAPVEQPRVSGPIAEAAEQAILDINESLEDTFTDINVDVGNLGGLTGVTTPYDPFGSLGTLNDNISFGSITDALRGGGTFTDGIGGEGIVGAVGDGIGGFLSDTVDDVKELGVSDLIDFFRNPAETIIDGAIGLGKNVLDQLGFGDPDLGDAENLLEGIVAAPVPTPDISGIKSGLTTPEGFIPAGIGGEGGAGSIADYSGADIGGGDLAAADAASAAQVEQAEKIAAMIKTLREEGTIDTSLFDLNLGVDGINTLGSMFNGFGGFNGGFGTNFQLGTGNIGTTYVEGVGGGM